MKKLLSCALLGLLLTGCGQSGPLFLPPLPKATTAKPAAAAPTQVNNNQPATHS